MATKYEVEVVVDADSAVRELDKLKSATERAGKAAKETMAPGLASAAKAQTDATAAARANAEQLNKNLTAAAAVGAAFSTLSAQLGPLGSALGASASAAGAMFAAFGPAGAAIGAVAGALPGLIQVVKELGTESRTSAQKIEDLRDRIRDTASAYLEAASSARDWQSALAGLLPLEEQQARLMAARAEQLRLRDALRRVDAISARLEATNILGSSQAQVNAVRSVQENLRRQLDAASREAEGLATGAGRALQRETNDRRFAEAQAEAEAIRAKNEAQRATAEEASERRQERLIAAKQKLLDLERMIVDEAARLAMEESAALKEIERRRIAEEDILRLKRNQADINAKAAESARLTALEEEERTQKLTQSAKDGAELERERTQIEEDRIRVTSRATAGMEGILDIAQRTAQIQRETNASFGEAFKTAVDEWLKGFALQEAYKGVAATAEAIGSAVTNQPNAAAKFAEAGIHFALAAAAGGASAAIPNGGGGGGGGGGGRRQGPEAVGGGASGGGGGGTIVVNFNAPVAEAEIGRQQERAARAARRRFGS